MSTPSTVPVPECDLVEAFRPRWSNAKTDTERSTMLRTTLAALLPLPALSRQARLSAIREITGLPSGVFREACQEVRRGQRHQHRHDQARVQTRAGKQVVDWVENRDTIEGLFQMLADAIRPSSRFFRLDQELIYLEPGGGPTPVNERNLSGLLQTRVELRYLRDTDEGTVFVKYDVLPGDLSRAFVSSPDVLRQLPVLRMYTRTPVFDRSWRFVGTPGYDLESGIFYDGPPVSPVAGLQHLEAVLRDFHWQARVDLVNFVGALLTALTMPHWGGGHPFLAINGNKPGVGKSTLARVLGMLVEGAAPCTLTYTPDEAELEKQPQRRTVAPRIEAGDRIVVLDNVKTSRPIESAVLERSVTDARLNFRRLGSNASITRPQNDLLLCLTMNLTQLGPDLRRRALPLNLELKGNVRATSYSSEDLNGLVLGTRTVLLGELVGLVQTWLEAGRPTVTSPARHSTGQAWAATINAILRTSGLEGFLSNFEASEHAYDPRYQVMLEVAQLHHDKPASSAAQWSEWLEQGPLEDRFRDRRGQLKSARSRATLVGSLFTEYLDSLFCIDGRTYALERNFPEGPSRSPMYGFRETAG